MCNLDEFFSKNSTIVVDYEFKKKGNFNHSRVFIYVCSVGFRGRLCYGPLRRSEIEVLEIIQSA